MSGRRDRDGRVSVLVRNLPHNVRAEDIRSKFERYGDVRDVYLPKDYFTGRPRGFGFVEFLDARDADEAVRHLDGRSFGGREISVCLSQEKRKTPREMAQREDTHRPSRRRSRSRSRNRRRYSRSRSRDRRRHSRSRSRDRHRDRSDSRDRRRRRDRSDSRSPRRSERSASRSRSASPQRSRSASPRRSGSPDETRSASPKRGGSRSRSASPAQRSPSPAGEGGRSPVAAE